MTDDKNIIEEQTKSQKASPLKSIGTFALAIITILAFRWAGYEPYVIPSGSMLPTLMVNDHILVNKSAFGLRWPFTRSWIIPPTVPQRGEIVVFRSVEKDDLFMIKRVVGLPGDKIQFTDKGELLVNGEVVETVTPEEKINWSQDDIGDNPAEYNFFTEKLGPVHHWVMYDKNGFRFSESPHVVPEGKLFMMGDNRDRSRDSRFWGDLPIENLLGRAMFVWLSCSKTVSSINIICDPRYIRWQRFFHKI